MSYLADLLRARDLWINLTLRELRSKYKRSVLGWGWSLLNPLATMAIFTVVFSVLLKSDPDPGNPSGLHVFALFLLCGLLPWNLLANSMSGGMYTLVGNVKLVKKVYFPREILVAANTASWVFSMLIEMGVLLVALLVFGNMTLPWLPAVLVLMVIEAAFVLGIALMLSVLNVYFRDTQHLVGIVLQVWFYGTPIIYPVKLVEAHAHGVVLDLYNLNPMVQFVKAYRNLLYDLRWPPAGTIGYLVLVSFATLAAGLAVFRRFEGRLAEELSMTATDANISGRPVIVVSDVTKRFRLYDERNQSLKAAVMRGRRARYEEFLALDDVSMTVREGTTIGLIGENGSGKSTLLKCMARILRPDRGTITVDGKVSALLELGAGFHPELSGRENVYLNGSILGLSTKEIDRRFDGIVEFAGLARFIDSPVKNYSSGMYVRLGFSVAINVSPDILLVDEVLAVGDEQFQTKCAEKFAELRADGKTIVLVSHALSSIRAMCEEAVWLERGTVRAIGAAGAIADQYVSEMHQGRDEAESHGGRWGSGEAVIERVELIGRDGLPAAHVSTGDDLTIRLHYRADEPIPRPVFGIAIHTLGGVHVTGPNTREADLTIEKISGSGVVDLHIPRVLLLPGTYDISASLADHEILHVFDFRQRVTRFDVDPGEPRESFGGVTSLGGAWRWQPERD